MSCCADSLSHRQVAGHESCFFVSTGEMRLNRLLCSLLLSSILVGSGRRGGERTAFNSYLNLTTIKPCVITNTNFNHNLNSYPRLTHTYYQSQGSFNKLKSRDKRTTSPPSIIGLGQTRQFPTRAL